MTCAAIDEGLRGLESAIAYGKLPFLDAGVGIEGIKIVGATTAAINDGAGTGVERIKIIVIAGDVDQAVRHRWIGAYPYGGEGRPF